MDRERSNTPIAGWQAYCVPMLLLCFSVVLMGWLTFAPKPAGPVMAIFDPGFSKEQTFAAALHAGASILGGGVWPNSLVVQSANSDFLTQLHAAGAWLIVDARGSGGCDSFRKTNL